MDKGDLGSVDPALDEATSSPETVDGKEEPPAENQPSTEEKIAELRREIDSGKQEVENLEAFVQMERAKLDDDPEYDRSFMLEALEEQEQFKDKVEKSEARLEEMAGSEE